MKEARFFARKPQIQLWIETGIHYSTISRIECRYIEPTDEQKKKLAAALEVDIDWLFPSSSQKKENSDKPKILAKKSKHSLRELKEQIDDA